MVNHSRGFCQQLDLGKYLSISGFQLFLLLSCFTYVLNGLLQLMVIGELFQSFSRSDQE